MKKNYDTEAQKLVKAIDIAIESYIKFPPDGFTKEVLDHVVNLHKEWKDSVLNSERKFRTLASLKYDIEGVFTYFLEGRGEAVEYFWQQLNQENLGYIREDKLRKILDRGKIRGRVEYELAVDSIVAAQQEGRITAKEAEELSRMIGIFESPKKNKLAT